MGARLALHFQWASRYSICIGRVTMTHTLCIVVIRETNLARYNGFRLQQYSRASVVLLMGLF